MKTVAVVQKNKCNFENIGDYAADLLYRKHDKLTIKNIKNNIENYIWSVIQPYLSFVSVNISDNEFLEFIITKLTENFPDKALDTDFFFFF